MEYFRINRALVFVLFIFISCNKSDPNPCVDFTGGEFANHGNVESENNYGVFANRSTFRELNESDPSLDNSTMFTFYNYDNCLKKSTFNLVQTYVLNDTVLIDPFDSHNRLFFTSADIYYGSYELNEDFKSWIVVTSLSEDQTEMTGQFELSFVTNSNEMLTPNDDPNRPDTLNYFKGSFRADLRTL